MRGRFWEQWIRGVGGGLSRFPVGWMAAIATADSEIRLPPAQMGYAFRHDGRDYRIQFRQLTRTHNRHGTNAPAYTPASDSVLFIGPANAP